MKKILFFQSIAKAFWLLAGVLIFGSFTTGYAQNEKINISIFSQKLCNFDYVGNVVVKLNGQSYQTDVHGVAHPGQLPPGSYEVSMFAPQLPNAKLAFVRYLADGETGLLQYAPDASGIVHFNIVKTGTLLAILTCDNTTVKVKIATTQSCTDQPNTAFSVQQGVSVNIAGKIFTSNANGVIETDLPSGTYPVFANWKDYPLGYVAQNGLRQKPDEGGRFMVTLSDRTETLEVRMLTCDAQGQAKLRATVAEGNFVKVIPKGKPFFIATPGAQLHDGDEVWIQGTAKLNWLEGNGTISFNDPRAQTIIRIGADQPAGKANSQPVQSTGVVQVLKGIADFILPSDTDRDLQRDKNGNIIRFGVSTSTIAVGIKGTVFSVGFDEQTQVSTVIVKEGTVWATPKNPLLKPFTLEAGQQAQVSQNYVSPVTKITALNIPGPAVKPQSLAPAPGWSRGQQLLIIDYNGCVSLASRALANEGYRIDYAAGGSFVVGIQDVHTAVIMCNPAAEGTWANVVVASNGEGGGSEREKLQARMSPVVSLNGCPKPDLLTTTFDFIDNGKKLGTIQFFADGSSKACCWTTGLVFWKTDNSNGDLMTNYPARNSTAIVTRLVYDAATCTYRGARDVTSQLHDGVITVLQRSK